MSNLHKEIEDLTYNSLAVQSSGTRHREVNRRQGETLPHAYSGYQQVFRCAHIFQFVLVLTFGIFVLFGLKRCMLLVQEGRLSQGNFVSVFFVMISLMNSVVWMGDNIGDYVVDVAHSVNMSDTLFRTREETHANAMPGRAPEQRRYHIGVENVYFEYEGQNVLKNVSLHFERGHCTALVGPIGAGKSTLLNLLLCLCHPSHGSPYIDGQWYADVGVDYIRERVSIVPQTAVLFNKSVLYNVRYGNEWRFTEAEAGLSLSRRGWGNGVIQIPNIHVCTGRVFFTDNPEQKCINISWKMLGKY